MSTIKNKNILVTGGAGGIGRLIGQKALEAGAACLVIWDIDRPAMMQAAEEFTQRGYKIYTYAVDVSDARDIYETADLVLKEAGAIDILVNNAGIVAGKKFHRYTPDEIEKTLSVNTAGVIHTTRTFIDSMMENGSGHIVNISSATSLMGNPDMSVYAGSKWAVTGWSESLRIELETVSPEIRVSTIQPGYINTGMFAGVEAPLLTPLLDPEKIAEKIIAAIKKNRSVVREPFMVKLIPFLRGILPSKIFDFIAGEIFGVYTSMDSFTGRKSQPLE